MGTTPRPLQGGKHDVPEEFLGQQYWPNLTLSSFRRETSAASINLLLSLADCHVLEAEGATVIIQQYFTRYGPQISIARVRRTNNAFHSNWIIQALII